MWKSPLIKRNKTLARALLYGAGTLVLAVIFGYVYWGRVPNDLGLDWHRPVEEYEAIPEVALLQEYIRIDTSLSGSEVDGAAFLAARLAEVGVASEVERIGERNANLWAIIEGDDPQALVLHNHIDVDEISRPEEWKNPPFGARIHPPWLIGRGAFDMKSVTIAQLMAVRELARSGVRPARSVIFLATGDEETGSRFGLSWFLREHPELASRIGTVLTEGGVVEAITTEDVKYWGLEFAQKRYVRVYACHSSRARLADLYDDVFNTDRAAMRRFLSPQMKRFLSVYGPTREDPRISGPIADLDGLLQDARFTDLPAYLRLMMRGDVIPIGLEEDPATGGYRLAILVAVMPGDDLERALEEALPAWKTHGITLRIDDSHPPAEESPIDHPDVEAILAFMRRDVPGTVHGPIMIPTAITDARIFRDHGIPAYGFSPFLILSTDTLQMKGPNERIALPAFIDGVRRYESLVRELVVEPATQPD